MKRWWHSSLILVLGCGAAAAVAEELQWRPASASKAAPALTQTTFTSPSTSRAPDSQVLPELEPSSSSATFRPVGLVRPAPLVRAQKPDIELTRPMPAGPSLLFVQDKEKSKEKKGSGKSSTKPGPVEIIPVPPRVLESSPLTSEPQHHSGSSSTMMYQGGSILGDECCEPCYDSCVPCCSILDDCGMNCWDACCCPPRPCFWFRAEFLAWVLKGDNYPALVTRSTNPIDAGILNRPSTAVLFGDDQRENDLQYGGRFTLGFWLPRHDCLGFDVSYFFLTRQSNQFQASSSGDPVLARPFNNADPNIGEDSQIVAFPNIVRGSVAVDYSSKLWGLEANLRHKLWCGPCCWVDLLYGYRHLDLHERLRITEDLVVRDDLKILVRDSFTTTNRFDGGQIGVQGEWRFLPRWTLGGHVKVGLGVVHQTVDIEGRTIFIPPGQNAVVRSGGLLALDSNIGRYERSRFAVMPEAGLKIGYDLTDHLRLYVGYDFLYLSDAVRPGDQIDRTINTKLLPSVSSNGALNGGPARPRPNFRTTDFWAQGMNFGLEYRW